MKERGIIFSGDNPKLILDGLKTQTRRIIKPQPESLRNGFNGWKWKDAHFDVLVTECPYGVAGDRLWIITIKALEQNSRYGAGDDGHIYRIDKPLPTRMRSASNGKGYQTVTLCENGKRKTALVHLLVCGAFYGERPAIYDEARHLDGDQSNNAAVNLDWGTRQQNWADRRFKGRGVRAKHHAAKITEDQAAEIRNSVLSQRVLAKKFGLSQSTVGLIKQGNIWNPLPPQAEPPNFARWKPLIVEITGVRVERVQDISEEDIDAEGMRQIDYRKFFDPVAFSGYKSDFRELYRRRWDSLHGKGAWERNDWVWVLNFKRV